MWRFLWEFESFSQLNSSKFVVFNRQMEKKLKILTLRQAHVTEMLNEGC